MLVVDGGSAEGGCLDCLQPSMTGVPLWHFGRCGKLSVYVRALRVSVTESLPMGFMVVPLTARGVMVDGRRLAGCSLSWWSKVVPPTQMSAHKMHH